MSKHNTNAVVLAKVGRRVLSPPHSHALTCGGERTRRPTRHIPPMPPRYFIPRHNIGVSFNIGTPIFTPKGLAQQRRAKPYVTAPKNHQGCKPCIQERTAGCKAYSLGCIACPRHRALPYAIDLGLSAQQVPSRRRRHCASINAKVDLNRHLVQFLHKMSPVAGFFQIARYSSSICAKNAHMKIRRHPMRNLCEINELGKETSSAKMELDVFGGRFFQVARYNISICSKMEHMKSGKNLIYAFYV